MTDTEYRNSLKLAQRQLSELYRQREIVERQIASLRQTVITLTNLLVVKQHPRENSSAYYPTSLTDAVQIILRTARRPLDPPDIRQRVEDLGYDIGSTNPLASIWSVLERMGERGEVRSAYQRDPKSPGEYLLYSRAFWWAENPNLPKKWVFPPEGAVASQKQRGAKGEAKTKKKTGGKK